MTVIFLLENGKYVGLYAVHVILRVLLFLYLIIKLQFKVYTCIKLIILPQKTAPDFACKNLLFVIVKLILVFLENTDSNVTLPFSSYPSPSSALPVSSSYVVAFGLLPQQPSTSMP